MSKVCLVVIDGWGLSENKEGNAIEAADTPVMDELSRGKAVSLAAHGRSVGLPDGLMGNSEVGHLNIGAGRVVYQDIMRINLAFETLTIETNEQLVTAAKRPAKKFHLLGKFQQNLAWYDGDSTNSSNHLNSSSAAVLLFFSGNLKYKTSVLIVRQLCV